MKLFPILTAGGTLAASTSAFAHGNHAALPYNSLLHLLVHNWPVLSLLAIGISALPWVLNHNRRP